MDVQVRKDASVWLLVTMVRGPLMGVWVDPDVTTLTMDRIAQVLALVLVENSFENFPEICSDSTPV